MGLTACGDPEEQSLCTVYADYVEAEAAVAAIDPAVATASEITATVEDGLAVVRHLGQVADSRYATPINDLEVALQDVLRTLASVDEDADYQTWQPLVEDSVEDARDAAFRVRSAIAPTCEPGS